MARTTRAELLAAVDGLSDVHPDKRGVYARGLLSDLVRAAVPERVGSPLAVRLKAELHARLDAMFAFNRSGEITDTDARDVLGDMIDTLLSSASVQAGNGISVDRSVPGLVTIGLQSGGGGVVTYPTLRFGTSLDATPTAGELSIVGVQGRGTIAAYPGELHHLIARLASEGDIHTVIYSDDQSRDNAFGAFAEWPTTIVPTGETDPFHVWVTNQRLVHLVDTVLTVS